MSKYNTDQRRILTEFFKNGNHKSFSVQDIFAEISKFGISMSAIYRNLTEMENAGIICKVFEKNRTGALYQYVDQDNCKGIIHLKCQSCDQTFHLNRHLSQMLTGMAKDEYNFTINTSLAFLYGKCDECNENEIY